MATYTLPPATAAWQTLPAPTADAWFQPVGGSVRVSTDATPTKRTAGVVGAGQAYPVKSGVAIKVTSAEAYPVNLRMWDK